MSKTIHAGPRTYLPFGVVAGFLAALQILILIIRGSRKDVWIALVIIVCLYSLFCIVMSRHKLIVTPDGVSRADLLCRTRYVAWADVRKRIILASPANQKPIRIDLLGDSDRLLLSVPIWFYSQSDSKYLMQDVFKMQDRAV